jgi:3-dehydroquinate synthase
MNYMSGDEFDMGRRNLLNYGHDFGHALESTSHFAIPHGQAVIFGILAANTVAQKRGILDEKIEQEIAERLLIPSLVIKPPLKATNSAAIIAAMKKDKKRLGNMLALIMMDSNHNLTRVNDLSEEEVDLSMNILKKRLNLDKDEKRSVP